MYPISTYLLDECVTLTLVTWTTDADGGRLPATTTVRTDVPAAVLPGKSVRLVSYEPDTGLRRVTVIWPVSVEFGSDVGLNVDDTIGWTDEADKLHTYQVEGYGPQPNGLWVATCREVM